MEELFNDRLKRVMRERGYNQKELAEKSFQSEAAISKYLSGARTPHLEILVLLAQALAVSSDYLLGLEEGSPEKSYRKIYDEIAHHKAAFSAEEKMKLIALLTM